MYKKYPWKRFIEMVYQMHDIISFEIYESGHHS